MPLWASDVLSTDLWYRIQHDGPFPEAVATPIISQLIGVLTFIQSLRFVHNGIRLDNILTMFKEQEHTFKVCLTGFSNAHQVDVDAEFRADISAEDVAPYIAPEMRETTPPTGTFATDIYALGVCFNLLVDGTRSWEMNNLIQEMLEEDPDKRATIDRLQGHPKIRGVKVEGDCAAQEKTLLDLAFSQSTLFLQTERMNPVDGESS
jgi:serine/threonine protein kinase